MALYLLVGERFNILGHGTVTVTSEDPLWPRGYLHEGDPGVPYASNSLASGQIIKVDANLVHNAAGVTLAQGFEGTWVAGAPAGWAKGTSGSATVTEELSLVHGGAKAVKLLRTDIGETAFIYVDFLVPSGWTFGMKCWVRSVLDGGAVVRIQDLNTGRYWWGPADGGPPSGEWAADPKDLIITVGSTYVHRWLPIDGDTIPIVAEPYSLTGRDVTTARVIIGLSAALAGSNVSYLDDFTFRCAVDFLALLRTSLRQGDSVQVHTSEDDAAYTLRATLSGRESQYATFSRYLDRFTRLTLVPATLQGTGVAFLEKPTIGELVLSQATELLRPTDAFKATWKQPQARQGRSGRFRFRETSSPHRELELSFLHTPEVASFEQMRDEIYRRSGGGVFPVVVAWPKDNQDPTATPLTDPQNVVYGVLSEDLELAKGILPHFRAVLKIEELPAQPNWYE